MTLGEFIDRVEGVPRHLELMIVKHDDEYHYAPCENVQVKPVSFGIDQVPDDEVAVEDCVVLSDQM